MASQKGTHADPAMQYDAKMIGQIDGIVDAASTVLEDVRAVMALEKATPRTIEYLQDLRDGLSMYLSGHDRGLCVPADKRAALAEKEHEATDLLLDLRRDDQDYECPEIRALRSKSLAATLRLLESEMTGGDAKPVDELAARR